MLNRRSLAVFASVDGLQSLSFTLCHVYARSTRSVSIPAPVYCEYASVIYRVRTHNAVLDADIVCSRAKNHYSPDAGLDFSEGQTAEGSAEANQLEAYKQNFKPIHPNASLLMYFS